MTKQDLRTVTCLRGPRSLPGGRIVRTGDTATGVDIEHPLVADLINQGALVAAPAKARRGRQTSDKEEGK
jgi:hypothetical protein